MSTNSNILHLSPEVIASWPTPNYEDPDRETWMPIYSPIWFAAATTMVAMRYWLRARGHAGKLGLDDAILFPAWVAGLMFTIVTVMYTERAHGDRHVWDVTPEMRQYAVLFMWLGQFSFLVCGGCTKVSILFFYRRLVDGTYSRRWTWLVWVAISFTIAYTIAFCVMLLVNCSPTEAYWRAFDINYILTHRYTCLDTSAINTITGVCAVISDVYAVALPCIITWHYTIPRRQKIALNALFSLGFIVIIASCFRTYWLIKTGNSKDVTRSAFNLFVWAQFELQVGIMCASAPSLRVFFRRYLGGSLSSRVEPTNGATRTAITVVHEATVTFNTDSTSADNKRPQQLHHHAGSMSEESTPSANRSEERLTRYSHEEDAYVMRNLSVKNDSGYDAWTAKSRGGRDGWI